MNDEKPQDDQESAPSELQAIENGYTDDRPSVKLYSHFNPGQGGADSPAPTPLPNPVVKTTTPPAHSSAGVIVLQWLTYAFWGWTLLATIWLVYIVMANFISGTDQTGVIPYAIAATLVLLPLSFICDFFYSRHEPAKKSGAATIVMVIHAVIFALFGIGVLISSVFLLVGMVINDDIGAKGPLTIWITLLISAGLYGATFLRTLNPSPVLRLGTFYKFGMLAFVGLFVVLAFTGPIARSLATRDDRALVSELSSMSSAIEQYTTSKKELPAKLSDVTLNPEAKKLVSKGLVEYKSEGRKINSTAANPSRGITSEYRITNEHRYQLCVTYVEASVDTDSSSYYESEQEDEYSTYPAAYNHPAGKTCYKLKVIETSQE